MQQTNMGEKIKSQKYYQKWKIGFKSISGHLNNVNSHKNIGNDKRHLISKLYTSIFTVYDLKAKKCQNFNGRSFYAIFCIVIQTLFYTFEVIVIMNIIL